MAQSLPRPCAILLLGLLLHAAEACVSAGGDPFASGSEEPCCEGTKKILEKEGNEWHYRCEDRHTWQPMQQPQNTPSPTQMLKIIVQQANDHKHKEHGHQLHDEQRHSREEPEMQTQQSTFPLGAAAALVLVPAAIAAAILLGRKFMQQQETAALLSPPTESQNLLPNAGSTNSGAGAAIQADPEVGPTTMTNTSVSDAPSTATQERPANDSFYYWVIRKLHYPMLVKSSQADYDKYASKYPIIDVAYAGDGRVPGYYYRSRDSTAADVWIPKDMNSPWCTWSLDARWYGYFKSSKVKRDGTFEGQPKDIVS
eukprot:TRINITY_DN25742_c0_g2_i1.p1 TRINITY_DN25742_c0_g2~~TRINITY_DN25742_c0_g2_i1.p1  ORF type:complete len:333 (+),score=54.49 TRINITY_DN25742_c0_g2_i1:64-999(+)